MSGNGLPARRRLKALLQSMKTLMSGYPSQAPGYVAFCCGDAMPGDVESNKPVSGMKLSISTKDAAASAAFRIGAQQASVPAKTWACKNRMWL